MLRGLPTSKVSSPSSLHALKKHSVAITTTYKKIRVELKLEQIAVRLCASFYQTVLLTWFKTKMENITLDAVSRSMLKH